MEQQSNEELLVTLSAKKEKAFSEEIPDAPLLSEIIEELNSLSQEDKYFFGDFASTLGEELFQKSVNIKGLTVSNFINNYVSNTESVESVAEQIKFIENQTEFNELFKDLVQNLPDHFEILKGYFITKLENNPLESYKLMVLYDSNYFLQPIKKKISGIINDAIFKEIKDYSEEISSGNFVRGNLLCLILLHPRTNNHKSLEELEDFLNNIFSSYKSFESFSLKNNRDSSGTFYESTNSVEDFFEELRYVNGTLLSNGSIRHEEEKIIKKLCSNFKTPLIIYKTISILQKIS